MALARRSGVSRSAQADSRRAVLSQDQIARTERRRQRTGQRLSVRRRQRHASAVRHACLRARVARHRAGDDDQRAARAQPTSIVRADSQSTRSASPARTGSAGWPASSCRTTRWRLTSKRNRSQVRAGPATGSSPTSAAPFFRTRLYLLRLVLPARADVSNRANLYGELPPVREHSGRGLREGHADADQLAVAELQLSAIEANGQERPLRGECGAHNGHGEGLEAEDRNRRRLMGTQHAKPSDFQVHGLRTRDGWSS